MESEISKKGVLFSAHLIEVVGNLKATPRYSNRWSIDLNREIEAEPVGFDPLTNQAIFWGEGCPLACQLEDHSNENEDIPF